jgi:hypothetical protein
MVETLLGGRLPSHRWRACHRGNDASESHQSGPVLISRLRAAKVNHHEGMGGSAVSLLLPSRERATLPPTVPAAPVTRIFIVITSHLPHSPLRDPIITPISSTSPLMRPRCRRTGPAPGSATSQKGSRGGNHRSRGGPCHGRRLNPARTLDSIVNGARAVRVRTVRSPGTSRPRDRHRALSRRSYRWRTLIMVGLPLTATRQPLPRTPVRPCTGVDVCSSGDNVGSTGCLPSA